MIETQGNILDSGAAVIVIPVNVVGIAGAGLALAARQRWPKWFLAYRAVCRERTMRPGDALLHPSDVADDPRIVSLATKGDWRQQSTFAWVAQGINTLAGLMLQLQPFSVAIPAVGCGLGGLRYEDVRPLIVAAAERMEAAGVQVMVFPPGAER